MYSPKSLCFVLFFAMNGSFLCADSSASIVGAGYGSKGVIAVAPGQIITFFVSGFAPVPAQSISATTLPLPYKLGGISGTLHSETVVPVPILEVSTLSTCFDSLLEHLLPCGTIVGVTVQIPFELHVDVGLPPPTFSFLTLSDDAGHSSSTRIFAEFDQIHIRTSENPYSAIFAAVTHGDGTAVDSAHPARPGE